MKNLKDLYPGQIQSLDRQSREVSMDGEQRILSFTPITGFPSADWYIGCRSKRTSSTPRCPNFAVRPLW